MTRKAHLRKSNNISPNNWQNQTGIASVSPHIGHSPHHGQEIDLPFVANTPNCSFSERQVKNAWLGLSEEQRELLVLYVAKGLTCTQIAKQKEQSRTAIRRALIQVYSQLLMHIDTVPRGSLLERF